MICALLQGASIAGQRLDCLGSPARGFAFSAGVAIVLVTLWLALRAGRPAGAAALTTTLFAVAALALATATERPVLVQDRDEVQGGTILVLADGSESFWRERSGAQSALALAADRIDAFLTAIPREEAAAWQGQILLFGNAVTNVGGMTAASNLPAALRRLAPDQPATNSDLTAGLRAALSSLREAPGRRMVVLVTDAQTAAPPGDDLLADYRAEAVPAHLVLSGASAPAAGLIAADLGPEHRLGEEAVVRATLLGAGEASLQQGDRIARADIADSQQLRPLRVTAALDARGLQGVALRLETDEGVQERALYTLVRGPARVLVYGAAPWADALSPDRWQVTRGDPSLPADPAGFDLVVIDGLAPSAFPADHNDRLLAAADGTGILIVNGPRRGGLEDEQVIADWNRSALDPILPVDSDPRSFVQDPPPRDIVVMVDVSGSMGNGTRLATARDVIGAILRQLRPQDSIAILPFNDSSRPTFPRRAATAQTLTEAQDFVQRLYADGGTAPLQTIQDSAQFVSNYCAFFFISDADFNPPGAAPQCHTTAISVSNLGYSMDVSAWGDEQILGEGRGIGRLQLEYFEPEERTEFWRDESFSPVVVGGDAVFATSIVVDGLAMAFPRVDATVELLHSEPPPDPLFAWRRDADRPGVATGAFLGEMSAEWGAPGALAATEAMLNRLLGWPDQDRYLIELADLGGRLDLTITPLTPEGQDRGALLSASLLGEGGQATGIALAQDPQRGVHHGSFDPPGGDAPGRAILFVQDGNDIQRVPVLFAPMQQTGPPQTEALVFGVDRELAGRIAADTQGQDLIVSPLPPAGLQTTGESIQIQAWFILAACLALATAIWSRELGNR